MKSDTIPASLFNFLEELRANNNRPWFNENKERYKGHYEYFKQFADKLTARMNEEDQIEQVKVYRIYRDIRFSKDKTPYKTNFSGHLTRATKQRRGGYYFHIEPGKSFVGGGFWGPNSGDLKRIRQEIAADDKPLREIISSPSFVETFGQLQGEQVKTAPKGYSKDHPAIDLLRYKQFLISRHFSDEEVLSDNFLEHIVRTFVYMRPFFDYMSEVLTTDANGVSIV